MGPTWVVIPSASSHSRFLHARTCALAHLWSFHEQTSSRGERTPSPPFLRSFEEYKTRQDLEPRLLSGVLGVSCFMFPAFDCVHLRSCSFAVHSRTCAYLLISEFPSTSPISYRALSGVLNVAASTCAHLIRGPFAHLGVHFRTCAYLLVSDSERGKPDFHLLRASELPSE